LRARNAHAGTKSMSGRRERRRGLRCTGDTIARPAPSTSGVTTSRCLCGNEQTAIKRPQPRPHIGMPHHGSAARRPWPSASSIQKLYRAGVSKAEIARCLNLPRTSRSNNRHPSGNHSRPSGIRQARGTRTGTPVFIERGKAARPVSSAWSGITASEILTNSSVKLDKDE